MSTTNSRTTAASDAALLSAGQSTVVEAAIVDTTDKRLLLPNPWRFPQSADTGWDVAGTIATDIRVCFHAEPARRTIWLVIDRDNAPMTGNYIFEADTFVSTYNATAGAPADVDALLEAWKDQINSDLASGGALGDVGDATVVSYRNPGSTDYDAIQFVALESASAETGSGATGIPAGADYATFSIGASTAAPEAADLYVCREVDSASLRIWTRTNSTQEAAFTDANNQATTDQFASWTSPRTVGALGTFGYNDRFNFSALSAVWPQLYDLSVATSGDESLTVLTGASGAGIYGLVNVATVTVAPQRLT